MWNMLHALKRIRRPQRKCHFFYAVALALGLPLFLCSTRVSMAKCVERSDASLCEWVSSKTISLSEFTDFYRPQPQPTNGSMPPPVPQPQPTNDRMRPGFLRPQPQPTNDSMPPPLPQPQPTSDSVPPPGFMRLPASAGAKTFQREGYQVETILALPGPDPPQMMKQKRAPARNAPPPPSNPSPVPRSCKLLVCCATNPAN
jgi:hypothetical protein